MPTSSWRYWRRFNLPNILYLLILIALAAASYWWVRKDSAQTAPAAQRPLDRVDGFAEQVELSQVSDNGKLLYQASMKGIEHFGNQNLNGTQIVLISTSDGQPKVTVTAQQAQWHSDTRQVDLTGGVQLLREQDAKDADSRAMSLTTDTMSVDMAKGMASSDAAFTMTNGASTLTGKRFRYDYQLRDLSMGGTSQNNGGRIKAQIANATKK